MHSLNQASQGLPHPLEAACAPYIIAMSLFWHLPKSKHAKPPTYLQRSLVSEQKKKVGAVDFLKSLAAVATWYQLLLLIPGKVCVPLAWTSGKAHVSWRSKSNKSCFLPLSFSLALLLVSLPPPPLFLSFSFTLELTLPFLFTHTHIFPFVCRFLEAIGFCLVS